MNNKLLEFLHNSMCDDYCRFPSSDASYEELEKTCDNCPFHLFILLMQGSL